jgi:predicted nucleotidyltransferase
LFAGVAKLADAADSKSADGNIMPVQVRPPAPLESRALRIPSQGLFILPGIPQADKMNNGKQENSMKIIGVIAEYNPFHNGHAYQLKKIKEAFSETAIVVAMSGSFTQRGEAAILDKWSRAEIAIENGADLVLELPCVFSVRSAQDFASGAVRLLASLGIQVLAFGAETNCLPLCREIALAQENKEIQAILHKNISSGCSYAEALTQALLATSSHPEAPKLLQTTSAQELSALLHAPNTILAIEYLRAIHKHAEHIHPLLVPRIGAEYHARQLTDDRFPSASGIREEISKGNSIHWQLLEKNLPAAAFIALRAAWERHQIPSSSFLFRPCCEAVLRSSFTQLQEIYGINEGLENRLIKAMQSASSLDELIDLLSTRRYPRSRVTRLMVYLLLHLTKADIRTFDALGPLYLRPLAFTEKGKMLLHHAKAADGLPIISHLPDFLNTKERRKPWEKLSPLKKMLCYDTWAADLRNLALPSIPQKNIDFLRSPCFISYPS